MTAAPQPQRRLPPPAGLAEAFRRFEEALAAGDVETLAGLFAPGETTLRGDEDGLRVGYDAVVQGLRGELRRLVQTHVQTIDEDHALVVALTRGGDRPDAGRGLQTQLWARLGGAWRITAMHVSGPAPSTPAS